MPARRVLEPERGEESELEVTACGRSRRERVESFEDHGRREAQRGIREHTSALLVRSRNCLHRGRVRAATVANLSRLIFLQDLCRFVHGKHGHVVVRRDDAGSFSSGFGAFICLEFGGDAPFKFPELLYGGLSGTQKRMWIH